MNALTKIKNLLVLGAATTSVTVMAQGTVTVQKVQGSKAIVKFEGTTPKTGETYDLGGGGGGSGGAGNRHMYLGLETDLFQKKLATGEVMKITLSGTPGWNFGAFELGVPIAITFSGAPAGSVSSMGFGAGIDGQYNFSENKPGEMIIPFVHAVFTGAISKAPTTADVTKSASTKSMVFGGGIGLKYFLNDQVAIVGGFDFKMTKTLIANTAMTKEITVPIGIRAYF